MNIPIVSAFLKSLRITMFNCYKLDKRMPKFTYKHVYYSLRHVRLAIISGRWRGNLEQSTNGHHFRSELGNFSSST